MAPANASTQPWTVARLLAWTKDHFEKRGIESPRLCAEILLADALGCPRLQLYTRHDAVPGDDVLARYRANVREAGTGKPIAYLIGYREFFALRFAVTPDVLIPRPETEVLVERVISLLKPLDRAGMSLLDVGTGSGCISIAIAKNLSDLRISASDVSEPALAVAKSNAAALGVAERIEFRAGDLLAPWADRAPFDVIVSNPPYVSTGESNELAANVRDFEPHLALFAGDDGLAIIRRLAVEARPAVRPGGHLFLEVAYNQARAACELLAAAGWTGAVTYRDDQRHERVVHVRRPT
jgi:release factor glutamine methyltransferase